MTLNFRRDKEYKTTVFQFVCVYIYTYILKIGQIFQWECYFRTLKQEIIGFSHIILSVALCSICNLTVSIKYPWSIVNVNYKTLFADGNGGHNIVVFIS